MKIKESFKNIKIILFKNISFIKFFYLCVFSFIIIINKSGKKSGVVGLPHDSNPGNNLLTSLINFSIRIFLSNWWMHRYFSLKFKLILKSFIKSK